MARTKLPSALERSMIVLNSKYRWMAASPASPEAVAISSGEALSPPMKQEERSGGAKGVSGTVGGTAGRPKNRLKNSNMGIYRFGAAKRTYREGGRKKQPPSS